MVILVGAAQLDSAVTARALWSKVQKASSDLVTRTLVYNYLFPSLVVNFIFFNLITTDHDIKSKLPSWVCCQTGSVQAWFSFWSIRSEYFILVKINKFRRPPQTNTVVDRRFSLANYLR